VKVIANGMKTYLHKLWRLWAKALGEKSGSSDEESDRIACIRTLVVLIYIITNFFIIAGVIRHW
jgi:hypothetical protein